MLNPPTIAVDELHLSSDRQVRMLVRLLRVAVSISQDALHHNLHQCLESLDFPRLFHICMSLQTELEPIREMVLPAIANSMVTWPVTWTWPSRRRVSAAR